MKVNGTHCQTICEKIAERGLCDASESGLLGLFPERKSNP